VTAPPADDPSLPVRRATAADRLAWDAFARDRADGNLLQTWGWGALKEGQGWRVHRWVAGGPASAEWRAVCQVLTRRLPGGWRYGYAPRGPALARPGDAAAASAVLAAAARALRRQRLVRLTCDPEWPVGTAATEAVRARCGLRELAFDVQHRQTWVVDLGGDEATLLAGLPAAARRNLRLAARAQVAVAPAERADGVADFFPLYAETVARQGYLGRPEAYLHALVAALGATVFIARLRGEPVAGAIAVTCGPRVCYLFGGTRPAAAAARPSYGLHFAIMRWGMARGCTMYDMWGVPRRFDPADPAHGYAVFKTRWGGRLVRHTGLQEVPLRGPLDPLLRRLERLALRRRPLLT